MSTSNENKHFYKTLLTLALPIIIQELINSSVNMLDVFMISKVGINEVAAVGIANQMFFLFILVCFGVVSGASIFSGQFFGKGEIHNVHKVIGICLSLNLCAASMFFIGGSFFPEKIMGLYSEDPEVVRLASDYLRIVCFSYFLSAVTMSFNAALRSVRKTVFPMTTTFIALFSNLVLSYIFLFVLHMGVTGAAISTVIARSIEIVAQLIIIFKFRLPVATKLKNYFLADKIFLKMFFKTTIPVILNEIVWALGTTIYSISYKFCGTEAQGSVQIALSIQNLFMVIGISIGSACGIILSNLLGSGEIEKAIRYSRKCLKAAVLLSIFMGAMLMLFSPLIVNFFDINDNVRNNIRALLYVIASCLWMKTFNYTTIVGILRSGGDTKFCLLIDGLGVWCVGVPLGLLGAAILHLDVQYVLLLIYSEELFKMFLSGKRTLSNVWAKNLVN